MERGFQGKNSCLWKGIYFTTQPISCQPFRKLRFKPFKIQSTLLQKARAKELAVNLTVSLLSWLHHLNRCSDIQRGSEKKQYFVEKKLINNIPKYATAPPLTRAWEERDNLFSESIFEGLLQTCLTLSLALDTVLGLPPKSVLVIFYSVVVIFKSLTVLLQSYRSQF